MYIYKRRTFSVILVDDVLGSAFVRVVYLFTPYGKDVQTVPASQTSMTNHAGNDRRLISCKEKNMVGGAEAGGEGVSRIMFFFSDIFLFY